MVLVQQIIGAVVQLLIAIVIPFIFYLSKRKAGSTFFSYIGLVKPMATAIVYALVASLLFVILGLLFAVINENVRAALLSPPSVTGAIRSMGLNATSVAVLLVIAWVKTSLSEEILFRGFIGKRLIAMLGFVRGNLAQAFIFGVIHVFLFKALTDVGAGFLLGIFVFSSVAGWTMGWLKEKHSNGSIIPCWIAHGFGNMVSYVFICFIL